MANPLRGEVHLDCGPVGLFTLVLDNQALASCQAAFGLTPGPEGDAAFLQRIQNMEAAPVTDVAIVLFSALARHHGPGGDRRACLERQLIRLMGFVEGSLKDLLAQSLALAFPEPEPKEPPSPKAKEKAKEEPWTWKSFMARATEAGISLDRFWRMTPREVGIEVKATGRRERETMRIARVAAWLAAYYGRIEKLPSLDSVIRPSAELTQAERDARQLDKLSRLAAATGGTFSEVKH